jgi:hypothetical protein
MKYVIPLIIVLLLVAGFVTFLVMNATRRGRSASRGTEPEEAPPGIGQDSTPLGDTDEHAGSQTESGRTVGGADAGAAGGTGQPVQSGYEGTSAPAAGGRGDGAHVRRSGEGEGTERLEFEDVKPPAAGTEAAAPAAGSREAEAPAPQDGREPEPAAEEPERELSPEDAERDRLRRHADEAEQREQSRPASEHLADRDF